VNYETSEDGRECPMGWGFASTSRTKSKKAHYFNTPETQSKISGLKKKDHPSENGEVELFRESLRWKKSIGTQ
jgi:hypothetical protein